MKFEMTQKEEDEAQDWLLKHSCAESIERHNINKRVVSPISNHCYKFTATSLGCLVAVQCCCGEEYDVTDVSTW